MCYVDITHFYLIKKNWASIFIRQVDITHFYFIESFEVFIQIKQRCIRHNTLCILFLFDFQFLWVPWNTLDQQLTSRQVGHAHSCSVLRPSDHFSVWALTVPSINWLVRRRVGPRSLHLAPSPLFTPDSISVRRVFDEEVSSVLLLQREVSTILMTAWGSNKMSFSSIGALTANLFAASLPETPEWPGQ